MIKSIQEIIIKKNVDYIINKKNKIIIKSIESFSKKNKISKEMLKKHVKHFVTFLQGKESNHRFVYKDEIILILKEKTNKFGLTTLEVESNYV